MNDLNLEVVRFNFTPLSTIGKLYVNGVFECYTLEDCVRDKKIYGITAIPTGTYKVILNLSNRFKRVLPLLIDVPNFEGVRIHNGNYSTDTDGCILVGETISKDMVGNSRSAMEKLMKKLVAAKSITITVR